MDLATRLEAWWSAFRSRSPLPAVAVGVSTPQLGRRVWCSGELDHQPVTGSTVFYGASLTKQLVGALVARAVLSGRVDPEVPVRLYLPGLPAWTAPVRVQHLLHHTAALPQPPALATALGHADGMGGWWRLDNASVLRALSLVPPASGSPGVRFAYDNTGYVLLAELLHVVEGRDLAQLARAVLLDPLGMTGSHIGGPPPALLPDVDPPPGTTGDGGLWTCVDDLLVWLDALNGQRLGADLTALVQTPGRLTDGTVLDYAWGVGLQPRRVPPVYEHGGSWPGWGAKAVRCPTTSTAVALLAVTGDVAALSAVALELHDLLAS